MKINRFKKLKNGQYKIELDQGNFIVHEDLILKYELLTQRELTSSLLEQIRIENQMYEAYIISLKMIKNKLRSKKELRSSLIKKGFGIEEIMPCLDLLESQGYINDESYAKAYLHDKMLMSNDGPDKIYYSLGSNGVESNIIHNVLKEFTLEIQQEKIKKIIARELKINRNKSKKILLQKITIHLNNLGYSKSVFSPLLEDQKVDDDVIKQKEYDKLYKKLSKKYEGKELELKLRQKMYQKGFLNYE